MGEGRIERQEDGRLTDEDHTGGGQKGSARRAAQSRWSEGRATDHTKKGDGKAFVDVRVPVEPPVVDVRASSDDACGAADDDLVWPLASYGPCILCGLWSL
jgi:hypothetical protein